jgi:hypothetical protein
MYKHKNFFCAQKAGFRIKLERIETKKREKEGGRDRKKVVQYGENVSKIQW